MRIKFQEGKYGVSKEADDGIIVHMTKDDKIMAIKAFQILQHSTRPVLLLL